MSELSSEDQKLMTNSNETNVIDYSDVVRKEKMENHRDKMNNLSCIRCRDANYQSSYQGFKNREDYPVESIDAILSQIPPNGNLVFIINAQDFPMSFNKEIFKYRNSNQIKFIITKNDLLFPTKQLLDRYGLIFYRDYLYRSYKIPLENIHVMSGLNDWNIKQLTNFLPNESYLIGHVNSGKSTIIQSLLFAKEMEKKQLKNSKLERKLQKLQDISINSYKSYRLMKKSTKLIKSDIGPASSYMPGFTRGCIPYQLSNRLTIYDVSGFVNNPTFGHGIYDLIDPKLIKNINKGVKVYNLGIYKSHYDTIRNDQVYTIGGLFLLKAPTDHTMIQIRNCINFNSTIFKDLAKTWDILSNLESNPSLTNKFLFEPSKIPHYNKFIIPPFHGSIDLVFKNLGHINLKATGAKTLDPLIIYLPSNMEAIVRQPITNFIMKTLSGRDVNGNPLRKENWVKKSIIELKRYTGSNFTSKLIPTSNQKPNQSDLDFVKSYITYLNGNYDEDYMKNWID